MDMTTPETIKEHRKRCQPYLARLQLMAAEAGPAPAAPAVAEVIAATAAILAEAQAAGQDVRAASGRWRDGAGAAALLQGRLNRLASAAGDAISAANQGDQVHLIRHLRRFDALTTAIWTVQDAVLDYVPARRLRSHHAGTIRPHGKELCPYRPPGAAAVLSVRTH